MRDVHNRNFGGSTVCKNNIPVIVYILNIMQNRISILFFSFFFWGGEAGGGLVKWTMHSGLRTN